MMGLSIAAATDTGRVRSQNQDTCVAERLPWPDTWLLAVADGMGGHHGGQVASRLAVDTLKSVLHECGNERPSLQLLRNAFHAANQCLLETAAGDPHLDGMGTTLTAAIWCGNQLLIAHVGDSRAYRINHRKCEQLTDDHSLVAEMVRNGDLRWDEALFHPQRHLLLRALGTSRNFEVDACTYEMDAGDLLLLVTDGLTSVVREDEIQKILSQCTLTEFPERLIQLANQRGGYDNITVVAARRDAGEGRQP